MRLIDADELIEEYPQASGLKLVIENAPTAYDVEKVVAELEEYEQGRLEMYDWQGQSAVSDAIDIVRKGGVE